MIDRIPSEKRHRFENDWLSSHYHFSFADYQDANNEQFGSLRVFNDDVIQPNSGFPFHAHREMEIVTIVLDGTLEHQDSLDNQGTIQPNEVQRMSAGTGIVHSERNPSPSKELHLLQVWVIPKENQLEPSWEQKSFSANQWKNQFFPIVSNQKSKNSLFIHQDCVFYRCFLEKNKSIQPPVDPKQKNYVFVVSGSMELNGVKLLAGDQARCNREKSFSLKALNDCDLIWISLP